MTERSGAQHEACKAGVNLGPSLSLFASRNLTVGRLHIGDCIVDRSAGSSRALLQSVKQSSLGRNFLRRVLLQTCAAPTMCKPRRIELWCEEVRTTYSRFHFGQELNIRNGGVVPVQPTGFIAYGPRQACISLERFEKGSSLQ